MGIQERPRRGAGTCLSVRVTPEGVEPLCKAPVVDPIPEGTHIPPETTFEAGKVGGFTVNQSFLLGTTGYVVIPSLMVFGALILRPRVNRVANIALGVVYALTIVSAAIGEWNYFILGSAIEVALLAAVVYFAWTWPKVVRA